MVCLLFLFVYQFQLNDGYPLLLTERAKQQLIRALWNGTSG